MKGGSQRRVQYKVEGEVREEERRTSGDESVKGWECSNQRDGGRSITNGKKTHAIQADNQNVD